MSHVRAVLSDTPEGKSQLHFIHWVDKMLVPLEIVLGMQRDNACKASSPQWTLSTWWSPPPRPHSFHGAVDTAHHTASEPPNLGMAGVWAQLKLSAGREPAGNIIHGAGKSQCLQPQESVSPQRRTGKKDEQAQQRGRPGAGAESEVGATSKDPIKARKDNPQNGRIYLQITFLTQDWCPEYIKEC